MSSPDEAAARNQQIRDYHARTGNSQRAVAEHFGVSVGTVNKALQDGKPKRRRGRRRSGSAGRAADPRVAGRPAAPEQGLAEPAEVETPDVHQTLARMLADQQIAIEEAEDEATAARLRRESIPILSLLQKTAPPPEEAAGVLVDPVAMAELGRAALQKLRDYADRAEEELLEQVRERQLGPGAYEVLRLIGVLPTEGQDDALG